MWFFLLIKFNNFLQWYETSSEIKISNVFKIFKVFLIIIYNIEINQSCIGKQKMCIWPDLPACTYFDPLNPNSRSFWPLHPQVSRKLRKTGKMMKMDSFNDKNFFGTILSLIFMYFDPLNMNGNFIETTSHSKRDKITRNSRKFWPDMTRRRYWISDYLHRKVSFSLCIHLWEIISIWIFHWLFFSSLFPPIRNEQFWIINGF